MGLRTSSPRARAAGRGRAPRAARAAKRRIAEEYDAARAGPACGSAQRFVPRRGTRVSARIRCDAADVKTGACAPVVGWTGGPLDRRTDGRPRRACVR
ncbi:hypothetical protein C6P78_30450 [Burkholderia multivorans]|nr:hypothetical protein C6P78_30450 [Burkholderia multivorans]